MLPCRVVPIRPALRRAAQRVAVGFAVATVPALLVAVGTPAEAVVADDCVAGQYFDGSECVPAEVGFYTDEDDATEPIAIPLGSQGTGGAEDGTGSTGTALCAAGTYRGDADTTFCVDAEAGTFVEGDGETEPTPCEAGTFQAETGQTACEDAPEGSFVAGTGATAATLCAAGSFSAATGASACTPAAVGSFVATTGATAQTAIPLGSEGTGGASDGKGSTGTDECEAGSYRGDAATTFCVDAAVGSFVASAGATAQTAIPLGSEGTGGDDDGTGSTGTDECEAGSYRGDAATTFCVDAAPGSFVATTEATAATTCPKGTFQPDAGQTSCDDAPAGSHVPVTGSTAAALCEPGTYTAEPGAEACTPADVGYYVPRPGATTQLRCITALEAGLSRCPVPAADTTDDADADEELAVGDEPLSAQGDPCEPGTWSATGTSRAGVSCTPASPGTFVADAGASAEEPCPAGTYSDTFGATACTPAPVGSYVAATGAMDPAPCPAATEEGATECPETAAPPEAQTVVEAAPATPVGWWIGGLALVLAAGGAGFVLVQRRTGILSASIDVGAGASTLTRLRGLDTTDAGTAAADVPATPDVLEWDEALDGRPEDEDGPPPQPAG